MPESKSKSYKKSKSSKNSKSGGRRRKHTMRKYRRGRKVMRGGAIPEETLEKIKNYLKSDTGANVLMELDMNMADVYNDNFETNFTNKYPKLSAAAKMKLNPTGYVPSV